MVHLCNGILHSRKKKGIPTIRDSMDGTGDYYTKQNKQVGNKQIQEESNEQNRQMRKIDPKA